MRIRMPRLPHVFGNPPHGNVELATRQEARITPEELKRRLDAAEPTFVLDLRQAMEFVSEPRGIPGSLRMTPEELEVRFVEIPRHHEVVLYCSCPNEASSARSALRLKLRGIERVRPLERGLPAWLQQGYPSTLA